MLPVPHFCSLCGSFYPALLFTKEGEYVNVLGLILAPEIAIKVLGIPTE